MKNQLQACSLDRFRFFINSRTTSLSEVTTGYLSGFLTVTYPWFGIVSQRKILHTGRKPCHPSFVSRNVAIHSSVTCIKEDKETILLSLFLDRKSQFCSNRMNLEQVTTVAKICFHLPSEIIILLLR